MNFGACANCQSFTTDGAVNAPQLIDFKSYFFYNFLLLWLYLLEINNQSYFLKRLIK